MRESRLYKRINDGVPVLEMTGTHGKVAAAYRYQFRSHLRDGYQIVSDTDQRFVVRNNNTTVEMWRESDPATQRK